MLTFATKYPAYMTRETAARLLALSRTLTRVSRIRRDLRNALRPAR